MDKFIGRKLAEEKDGIFLWMLQGLKTVIDNGNKVFIPKSLRRNVKKYMFDNDPVAQFVDECCVVGNPKEWTPSKSIYQAYRRFCERFGYKPFGHAKFSHELMRAYPKIKEKQKRYKGDPTRGFKNISLQDEDDD